MTDDQRYALLLIEAICGVGFPSLIIAQECERVGMADLNDSHDGWVWDRRALLNVDIEDLQELYDGLCDQREKNMVPTEPLEEPQSVIMLAI